MKKILCAILICIFLLSACATLQESEPRDYPDTLLMQEVDLMPKIRITPLLYFLNEAQTRLMAETRDIFVPQNKRKEEYVVQALLDGPVSAELSPVGNDFTLEYLEVMPEVINVYFATQVRKTQDELLNLKIATSSTLSDFSNKKYINVYVNGVQTEYMGLPTGALQKLTGDLAEEKLVLQGKSDNPDMQAVLYFLDSSEQYLLPETRKLVFKERDFIKTLVEQLIRGPDDSFNHKPVLDSSMRFLGYEIKEEDGQNIAWLHFNRKPVAFTDEFVDGSRIALASLAYTITGFVPNIHGIKIVVGAMQSESATYRAESYQDLMGTSVTIYLPNSNASSLLVGVPRVVKQDTAFLPETVLRQVLGGPTKNEVDVYPAIPDGFTMDTVLSLYTANDIIVLDLDASVMQVMENISEERELLMVYALVNSLTSIEGIRRVQFLLDGERVEHLGPNQTISVIDPLIRNPGIVRE